MYASPAWVRISRTCCCGGSFPARVGRFGDGLLDLVGALLVDAASRAKNSAGGVGLQRLLVRQHLQCALIISARDQHRRGLPHARQARLAMCTCRDDFRPHLVDQIVQVGESRRRPRRA